MLEVKRTGNKMTLTFDIVAQEVAPLSASQKSKVLASTHGFEYVNIDKDLTNVGISLNVIKPFSSPKASKF